MPFAGRRRHRRFSDRSLPSTEGARSGLKPAAIGLVTGGPAAIASVSYLGNVFRRGGPDLAPHVAAVGRDSQSPVKACAASDQRLQYALRTGSVASPSHEPGRTSCRRGECHEVAGTITPAVSKHPTPIGTIALLLWVVSLCVGNVRAQLPDFSTATTLGMSSVDEIAAEFTAVTCNNDDRLAAAMALFEKLGASRRDISVNTAGVADNMVLTLPGTSAHARTERIVIGAHYDKVSPGCGAFDNWTGIVAIGHMYLTIKSLKPSKTIVFVGFGEEEKGLVGSRAMVNQISSDQATEYCAMINMDSLGNAMPQAFDDISSGTLVEAAARAAKDLNVPFARVTSPGTFSDSLPFIAKGIPAITLVGMTSEWPKILHSINDTADKIDPQSVYAGYRVALSLLGAIDRAPCHAFR